jgi:hypothetical protein
MPHRLRRWCSGVEVRDDDEDRLSFHANETEHSVKDALDCRVTVPVIENEDVISVCEVEGRTARNASVVHEIEKELGRVDRSVQNEAILPAEQLLVAVFLVE